MRRFGVFVAAAVLASATGAGVASAGTAQPALQPFVVTFRPGVVAAVAAGQVATLGGSVTRVFQHALSGVAVRLPAGVATQLASLPMVASVVPDVVIRAFDTQTGAPWGLDRSDQRTLPLSGAYTYPGAGAGVSAYVIDTGVLATHADFGARVVAGFDAIGDGRGTTDCNGHGTHVASTLGGTTYGMAKQATIVPVRVLDCTGSGTLSGVIAGIDWVVAHHGTGPAVANMSLGGGANSTIDAAVQRLIDDGVTTVVAAGNDGGLNACNYSPARAANAITVGATTSSDARASYSNVGTCLDLFAPGSSIAAAWHTSTTAVNTISGTSMATPHVAGAAAVLLGQQPTLTPAQVTSTIVANATTNVVSSPGTGSPNRLLYSPPGPPPVGAPAVTTTTVPSAFQNEAYSTTLAASGGTAPYQWALTGGGLPTGLQLSAGGVVSGTPTASGTWTFTVTVTDAAGLSGTATLQLRVVAVLAVTTSTLPSGTVGVAYSATLAASGGQAPYSWQIVAGGIQPGLTLNSTTGAITGTPTSAGSYSVTFQVADAGGRTATRSLTLTVAVAQPPGTFAKSSPANNSTGVSRSSLKLSWTASAGAVRYEWCADTVNNNVCDGTWRSTTARSVTVAGLSSLTAYYWQVRSVNAAGLVTQANTGTWWKFTTRR